jgi:acyl carrier protein
MSHAEQIRSFLADAFLFNPQGFTLGDDDSLMENGVIDSTGVLELTQFVEDTFEIAVDDQDITPENFDSVQRIADYVARKQSCAVAAG